MYNSRIWHFSRLIFVGTAIANVLLDVVRWESVSRINGQLEGALISTDVSPRLLQMQLRICISMLMAGVALVIDRKYSILVVIIGSSWVVVEYCLFAVGVVRAMTAFGWRDYVPTLAETGMRLWDLWLLLVCVSICVQAIISRGRECMISKSRH